MLTYTFTLRPNNRFLWLRLRNNNRKAEFSLGIVVTEKQLEDYNADRCRTENVTLFRALDLIKKKIKDTHLAMLQNGGTDNMDIKEISQIIRSKILYTESVKETSREKVDESKLFGKFYEKKMNGKANKGYKTSIESTLKKMQAFCAAEDSEHGKPFDELTFEDITLRWLNAFDEWMIKDGLKQNSRNIHFKNIRTVINRAIDEELTEKYPFRRFKIRPEETRKRSLTVEELRTLFNYPVEEYQKFYLDMFRLMIMLCGINSTDLFNLTEITKGRIEYRRAKTHKWYSIKVEPEAMEIINRWRGKKNLLCIADRWKDPKDFNKNMNIALKKIGCHEQIPGRGGKIRVTPIFPDLSTYYTRHSWATIAYNDCGVSKDIISQALGHSTGSAVTDIYLNKDQRLVDEANRKVLDYIFKDK